jgi:guanine deaminase
MLPQLVSDRAYLADVLHAPVRGEAELLSDALITVRADGTISAVRRDASREAAAEIAHYEERGALVRTRPGQYLLPGMVDLHVHAPQWPQLGKALDLPLEEWLQAYTFPLEARYADTAFAQREYDALVENLLANGTTCALYFGTIHLAATQALADICLRRSQRALIGRVAMDNPEQCPDYYRDESSASAESGTRAFISYVRSMPGNEAGLIKPVITPRFIPSCTDALLRSLGALARETGCHVQTHCSESDWEHQYVIDRYGITDTAALERLGLLGRHTVLAHGNFLGDEDLAVIGAQGAGIAHCPLSNVYFSDAILPLRHLLAQGIHVGLGTDIAGGASPSILENARHAVIASRYLEAGVDAAQPRAQRRRPGSRIDALTAFWLATAGGGIALDLPVGLFKPGFQFDALLVDGRTGCGNLRLLPEDSVTEIVQKIIYHGARENICRVWVANRLVHTTERSQDVPRLT